MSLVAVVCLGCSKISLASSDEAQQGPLLCETCGAHPRVIPGCLFPDHDRERFDELSTILGQTNITPAQAQHYAADAARSIWDGGYSQQLDSLGAHVSALLPLRMGIEKSLDAERHTLLMLQVIFQGLAQLPRASAEYAVGKAAELDAPSQRTHKRGA